MLDSARVIDFFFLACWKSLFFSAEFQDPFDAVSCTSGLHQINQRRDYRRANLNSSALVCVLIEPMMIQSAFTPENENKYSE